VVLSSKKYPFKQIDDEGHLCYFPAKSTSAVRPLLMDFSGIFHHSVNSWSHTVKHLNSVFTVSANSLVPPFTLGPSTGILFASLWQNHLNSSSTIATCFAPWILILF